MTVDKLGFVPSPAHPAPDSDRADVLAAAPRKEFDEPLGSSRRPSWRGRVHAIGLSVAVPSVVGLAIAADGARSRAAVIVYAIGLSSMLAVSATYHRWVHTVRARMAWRRADHATIYGMIAGACTALALTSLDTRWAVALLIPLWGVAAAGALSKAVLFDRSHRYGGVLYILLGWSGLLLVLPVWRHSGAVTVGLLVGGGVVYTVGALAFHRRWPKLSPARFSYHEVWHVCTIAAAGLHFAAVASLAT